MHRRTEGFKKILVKVAWLMVGVLKAFSNTTLITLAQHTLSPPFFAVANFSVSFTLGLHLPLCLHVLQQGLESIFLSFLLIKPITGNDCPV